MTALDMMNQTKHFHIKKAIPAMVNIFNNSQMIFNTLKELEDNKAELKKYLDTFSFDEILTFRALVQIAEKPELVGTDSYVNTINNAYKNIYSVCVDSCKAPNYKSVDCLYCTHITKPLSKEEEITELLRVKDLGIEVPCGFFTIHDLYINNIQVVR